MDYAQSPASPAFLGLLCFLAGIAATLGLQWYLGRRAKAKAAAEGGNVGQ